MLKRTKVSQYFWEFFLFGLKQVRACIFAGTFFVLLFASHYIHIPGLSRYDFLFVTAMIVQVLLVVFRIESKDELKVICVFHVLGLALELFKTSPQIASWSYPEEAFFKIRTVPLYSGFMYASVASYITQAWRLFDLKLKHYPSYVFTIPLIVLIYANFFTKHFFVPDIRWWLIAAVVILFWRSQVFFTPYRTQRSMPLIVSFALIGFFIWVAENISTFLGAWQYPDQQLTWTMVSFQKFSSWFLLIIVSFFIIVDLRKWKTLHVRTGRYTTPSTSRAVVVSRSR